VTSKFSPRPRLRQAAAQALLVWLFALAASIVNACVLEPESRPVAASSQRLEAGAPRTVQDEHPSGHGDRPPDPGQASCTEFCDEPAADARVVKLQPDPFNAAWLAPARVGVSRVDAAPGMIETPAASHALWRPAASIPIAFLRLAL
jgi:hypothetical protein